MGKQVQIFTFALGERSEALNHSAVEGFYCSSPSLICGAEYSQEYSLINFSDG